MGVAIFTIFIILCFHNEIRKCCDCLTPRRKFLPDITYKADPEQIIISQEALTLAERSSKNRVRSEGELLPSIPVEKKATSADNKPNGLTSAGTCGPKHKVKTTRSETCDLASAVPKKKSSVRFLFPSAKRQEK